MLSVSVSLFMEEGARVGLRELLGCGVVMEGCVVGTIVGTMEGDCEKNMEGDCDETTLGDAEATIMSLLGVVVGAIVTLLSALLCCCSGEV